MSDERVPGGDADTPTEIPARGWLQITKRAWQEGKQDQIGLLAAGVAYYGFLALFPGLLAAVLLYGLIASPADVQHQIESIGTALPSDARSLLSGQLTSLTSTNGGALGIGLVIAVAGALWSASGGMKGLIGAVNVAYDEEETRGFVKLRGLSLLLTLGAIVFVLLAVGLVAVVPAVADAVGLSGPARLLAEVLRWALLLGGVMAALALVYRLAPDRDAPRLKWVSVGAVVATVVWLAASVGFSLYVDNFGKYGKTYGSLAGVIVLLLWLYLTAFIVLLGAEVNAESEQQTVADTTKGEPLPLGERRAVKADSTPSPEAPAEPSQESSRR